jgi:hypothetical protein
MTLTNEAVMADLSWLRSFAQKVTEKRILFLTFLNPLTVKSGFQLHRMGDSDHYFGISMKLLLAKTER